MTAIPTAPRDSPLLHNALKVFTRGPAVALRHWRKRKLRAEHGRGCAKPARSLPAEESDPGIVATGRALREQLLATYQGRHAAARYRVLMLRPSSITAEVWFGGLQQCMQHAGIVCRVLPPHTPAAGVNAAFEELQPNVFIASESAGELSRLDLAFIRSYKRSGSCLRMFVPVWHARIPRKEIPGRHSTVALDAWRRRLRRGNLIGDAHLSIFEPEFHERFSQDPAGPAVPYVVVPQGCNPFRDFPVPAVKCYDYFIAASMTDERVEVAHRFLRPILGRYCGLWAGPDWGFGEQGVPLPEMSLRYAQARIALSPLVGFVHRYAAELSHRVYAAAACGAFQLTMPIAHTHRYFRPDELAQAATPAEYTRMFDHFVSRPGERNAIALAALRRAYGEHTCFHRIDKLVTQWDDWRRQGLF
jgi:Glycosyl transferases group 1